MSYHKNLSLMENQIIDLLTAYFPFAIQDMFIVYITAKSFDRLIKACKFAQERNLTDLVGAYSRMISEE